MTPPSTPARLTRRAAMTAGIAGVGIWAVTACSSSSTTSAASPASTGPGEDHGGTTSSADATFAAAVADEWQLVARYDTAIAAYPGLESSLAPLRADHVAHAQALGSPSAPASPTVEASSTQARTLNLLAAAEVQARAQRIDACDAAADESTANLLAQIAASEAAHAAYLAQVTG